MVPGRCQPLRHVGCVFVHGHAGERCRENLFEVFRRQPGDRFAVTGEDRFERSGFLQAGPMADDERHALQAIDDLRIHRVLDPERAVLIERRDPLGGRHEPGAARICRLAYERQNCGF